MRPGSFIIVSLGTSGAKMYLNNVLVSSNSSTATLKTLNTISPITDINVGTSLAFVTSGPQYRWMFNGYIYVYISLTRCVSNVNVTGHA